MKKILLPALVGLVAVAAPLAHGATDPKYSPTVQAEKLDRGVVAIKGSTGVFVSWRSLLTDKKGMTFNLYRGGEKLNTHPIVSTSCYLDAAGTTSSRYELRGYVNNEEVERITDITPWANIYKKIHIDRPAGGTISGNSNNIVNRGDGTSYHTEDDYTYSPNAVSVGDVDGDGQWEYIVKWTPSNQADNSEQWFTSKTYYDCYKEDGTKLWRIDMGRNIRSGNHYTQFLVYDFDGDGKAEFMVKTAPGTVDGQGKNVLMGTDKADVSYVNNKGVVTGGPEYLTVFNGETGAEISTIAYNPPRSIRTSSQWGDSYYNRSERYLACVAYLDGKHPSAVFCRGYYTAAYLWAVDFDGKELKEVWLHKSETSGKDAYGEGAHSVTVGDVDGDGCDEIIYGACAIDHNGKILHRTGGGHGDALHLTDLVPEREGLEIFMVHEEKKKWDAAVRDANTGEILYFEPASKDNGRGVAANISSKYPGYEWWSQTNVLWAGYEPLEGAKIPDKNFRVYWDGDLLDELYEGKGDGPSDSALKCSVTKSNEDISKITTLIDFATHGACHSFHTKRVPLLQADLFGDWREEMIFFDKNTVSDLLIFSTVIPTNYRVTTLMQDRQYRLAAAWQNVAYNQPPHLGYNLEESFNIKGSIVTSGGSTNQVLYMGDPLQTIQFKVERATGVMADGLPKGVTLSFDPAKLTGTISGTPEETGEFNYYITTTGANNNDDARIDGTFNVRLNTSLTLIGYFPFEAVGATTPNLIEGEAKAHDSALGSTADGRKGKALQLSGGASYEQPHYSLIDFGDKSFTIELWMNSDKADANAYLINKGVISPSNGSGNWTGIEYKDNKGVKELRFAIDDNVTKSEIKCEGAEKYYDGNWHHIVAARDASAKQLFLYVDGELVASGAETTGAIKTDEPLAIGNTTTFDNPYTGLLDEISIYQGSMSALKVKERYQAGVAEYLAYLPLDIMTDATPNVANGEATYNGATAPSITKGVLGGAMSFDGTHYLTQPIYEGLQFGGSDFTIELWARSTDDDAYLLCVGTHNKTNVEGGTGNWVGLERTGGKLRFSIDDDKTKTDCQYDEGDKVFDGEWHHIACVRNAAAKTTTLYVDGQVAAHKTGVSTGDINFSATELFFIGGDDEPTAGKENRTYSGDLDELTIHPKAMTAEEVEQSYMMLRGSQSGLDNIVAGENDAPVTIIDAMSGRVMGIGTVATSEAVLECLPQGVYLMVIDRTDRRETYKFIRH